jgi:phage baseplate assembly protein W
MPAFSPKLPLERDRVYGYAMNEKLKDVVTQNLKMLLLTSPGERVMDPEFGAGLRRQLFKMKVQGLETDIRGIIYQQVKKYMPYVEIPSIEFADIPENPHALIVVIHYIVPSLSLKDVIDINISLD